MSLTELLEVEPGLTAVVGSGGKTTLLRVLGGELAATGHTVILTTTTKILPFSRLPTLTAATAAEVAAALRKSPLLCLGSPLPGSEKLTAPALAPEELTALAEYVLVEADGAHHRPLKAHAAYEPVIPSNARGTICVVGLSGLGQPIAEAAHRPEVYARLAGATPETPVTPALAAAVLRAEERGWRFFFNQADTPERREVGRALAAALGRTAVMGSLREGVYERCL